MNDTYYPDSHQDGPNPDSRLFVQFHLTPMENARKSADAGRPVFDDVEFIKIAIPGDKDTEIDRPVTEIDKRRFARKYMDWKSGAKSAQSGTPLSQWPAITRAQVEELAYFNVHTVEQLVSMPDGNASRFPGIQALKQKAQTYLAAAAGHAPVEHLRSELESQKNENELMRRQLADMAKAIAELNEKKPTSSKK